MRFREIREPDVPGLFAVRVATRENALSREELSDRGITEDSVHDMLKTTHRGWLCEQRGKVAGFAMGNGKTGEMWVVAVLPGFEGRGIGSELITRVENWLWSLGWTEAWLTTDIDTRLRAYGFYVKQGWTDSEIRDGNRYMTKGNPDRAAGTTS